MGMPNQILSDENFWLRLEFDFSRLLEISKDKSLSRFWCDGFLPDVANLTGQGMKVEGVAWIGDHDRNQYQFRFIALIAQRLLSDTTQAFSIEQFRLDENAQTLELFLV